MCQSTRLSAALLWLGALAFNLPATGAEPVFVPVTACEQTGRVPEGLPKAEVKVLANEPTNGNAGLLLRFDLEAVAQSATPRAFLQLGNLEKQPVKRPGQKPAVGRGALHVFTAADRAPDLVGSTPVKPGNAATPYGIDVTRAVSDALGRPAGQRKLRLEVRITGAPAYFEIYGVLPGTNNTPPTLEIASPANWTNDWAQRLQPIARGPLVYREACMPIAESPGKELSLPLLYPAKKIIEVIHNGTGEKLQSGRDWVLRDGKLVLPPGSHAPIQLASEFFLAPHKETNGTTRMLPSQIRLTEGTWYHQRQIEVTYEPAARDWQLPAAVSSPKALPRLQKLLAAKAPIKLLAFGDSISLGGNASKVQGAWPYQPAFGELVAWAIERQAGSKVTFMNHSRGGAGAVFGASQAASQVGWFKPDVVLLHYGMNDRRDERRATYKAAMEQIIDTVRKDSPDTEFILVTSIVNNPKQPTGLGPIQDIRDRALKISRPGLAFVDFTSTHLELLKHKNYLDTSGNGANHPNDFIHRLYAQRILEVILPAQR
jgi:lysophospholipase L1-like esterase